MFFERIRKKAYDLGYIAGYNVGADAGSEAVLKSRKNAELLELRNMVEAPVIYIPNEWCDPIIGFGNRVEFVSRNNCPILIVDDCISGTEKWAVGPWFHFSEQKLMVLSKLDPFERWAMHSNNACGHRDFDKLKSGDALLGAELVGSVKGSFFWARWLEFKHQLHSEQGHAL